MKNYTTAQIAKLIGVHPNTVLKYEKWGYIEEVKRKSNGYRIFTERHLAQMMIARNLLKGDLIKIEFRIRAVDIIKTVVNNDLELALKKSKDYLLCIEDNIKNDLETIKGKLLELNNTKLKNINHYYKTNEVAKIIGVSNDVLISWERNGLLNIVRNETNNYRIYSDNDLIMASFIKTLRELNYIISYVYKLINTTKLYEDKTIKEIIYDLYFDHNLLAKYDELIKSLNELKEIINDVVNYIDQLIDKRGDD